MIPENIKAICEGRRPDLTPQQLAGYCSICERLMGRSPGSSGAAPTQNQPTLLIRGWNFAAALARWTLAGMPRRNPAAIAERLAICQACEYLVDNNCTKCGCACIEQNQIMNKLALATERCPEGKWS